MDKLINLEHLKLFLLYTNAIIWAILKYIVGVKVCDA